MSQSRSSSPHSFPDQELHSYPRDTFPQPTLSRLPSTSTLSVHSNTELYIPDAADAVGALHPPDIDKSERNMEPGTSGHRRRRSSLMNPVDTHTSTSKPKSKKSPSSVGGIPEDGTAEEIPEESGSEDMELNELSDDDLQDDEETGLTAKDKKRRGKRRRRNTLLDQRIVGDPVGGALTDEEKKEADQYVVKNLLLNGVLIGLWYLFSLSISIYNKWMFSPTHLDFHFPLFTTSFHMLVQFSLASLVLYFLPSLRPRYDSLSNPHNHVHITDQDQAQHKLDNEKPLMTRWFYFSRIGPCGLATGLDIGLGNMSLKFITLTFYTMTKSSTLIFVLLFAFLFRLETPSWKLILIILTMTLGVLMMVAGEVAFSTIGFILILSAAFFSGFRWGLTQILLLRNPATSNPFSSIFYLAPIMFFSLLIIAIPVEGIPSLIGGLKILVEVKGPILGPLLLLFPGCIAFLMTASEFALLQRTSVVTLSIAGIFKEVVTISAAGLVFGDALTPINISGLVVTISAIAAYNYIKIRKMRSEAREEVVKRDRGGDDSSDADGEESEEDWNAPEGTYVTSDGDILPNLTPKKAKAHSSEAGGSLSTDPDVRREEVKALAAAKKELSE